TWVHARDGGDVGCGSGASHDVTLRGFARPREGRHMPAPLSDRCSLARDLRIAPSASLRRGPPAIRSACRLCARRPGRPAWPAACDGRARARGTRKASGGEGHARCWVHLVHALTRVTPPRLPMMQTELSSRNDPTTRAEIRPRVELVAIFVVAALGCAL